MAKPLVYNATLVERIDLEPALSIFKIKPDEAPTGEAPSGEAWFVPGQYMTIGLNRDVVPGERVCRNRHVHDVAERVGELAFGERAAAPPGGPDRRSGASRSRPPGSCAARARGAWLPCRAARLRRGRPEAHGNA